MAGPVRAIIAAMRRCGAKHALYAAGLPRYPASAICVHARKTWGMGDTDVAVYRAAVVQGRSHWRTPLGYAPVSCRAPRRKDSGWSLFSVAVSPEPHWPARWLRPAAETGIRRAGEWAETVVAAAPGPVRELTAELVAATEQVHISNARNVPLGPAAPPAQPVVLVGAADHAITPAAGVGAWEGIENVVAVYEAITTGESPAAAMSIRRHAITEERNRVARRMRSPAATQ